jgi:alanine dehydrogenase
MMTIGLIREEKKPHDRRVCFTPAQCKHLMDTYPGLRFVVQPSPFRIFSDEDYRAAGIPVSEDLSSCNLLMGIKEVPPSFLMEGKTYMFFSHTIKKQPRNQKLLQEILRKKITLIDYECLTDREGNRIIGFGRFAGIVGAYNGIMGYGLKYNLFNLKPAHLCYDKKELFSGLDAISLPNIKIVVTGSGRAANGACETLGAMNIRKVTPYELLNYTFREPVYAQLRSENYYRSLDGSPFSAYEFHHFPENFRCTFSDDNSYASVTDILLHCTYWDPRADVLFTLKRMSDPDFRISVIADITCDLNGSIPSTFRYTTIEDKFYGYDPITGKEVAPFDKAAITVMAIDNLPCELPRDASEGFGRHLTERVMPALMGTDPDEIIPRATIASGGKLMPAFEYLKDYAQGLAVY